MACAVADLLRDIFFVAMRSLVEQEDKGKHVKASRVAGPVPLVTRLVPALLSGESSRSA